MKAKKSKSKGKGKGKGGKKSRGRDSEWEHEGGQGFLPSTEDAPAEKPRYRRTQEKDESIRRSRFKQQLAKQQQLIKQKLRHKISFSDVLKQSGDALMQSVVQQAAKFKDPKGALDPNHKNDRSVVDRLHAMIAAKSGTKKVSRKYDEDDDDEDEEEFDEEEEDEEEGAEEYEEEEEEEAMKEEYEVEDAEVNDDAASDGGDERDEGDDAFHTFFSSDTTLPTSRGKMKRLASLDGIDIYGDLSPQFAAVPTMQTFADVPGLNKLWNSLRPRRLDAIAAALLPHYSLYSDILIDSQALNADSATHRCILLHALIHIIRARNSVLKHNSKLKKKKLASAVELAAGKGKKKATASLAVPELSPSMQDQGFTRARILFLCPFRSSAMGIVQSLRELLGDNTTVSSYEKFVDEFGAPEEDESEKRANRDKPEDWRVLFDGQNVDDDFKLGVQINPGHGRGSGADKGVYVRLFCDFYQSDILIASPLGLRLLIENKGKGERDFLSSIEMVYIQQADVLYYQNWEHVDFVLRNLNHLPASDRGTDFSRVRPYFLEAQGNAHRQLVISTAYNTPMIQASFREFGASVSNKIKCREVAAEGAIAQVVTKVKQVFQKVAVASLDTEDDDRYQYFIDNVVAPILRMKQNRTLIITPSYLHYVRVRNYLLENEVNAAYICEYSRDSEISRGRSRFFHGKHDILLYSGRAHFFRRFHIRGAMHLVFFSLPDTPEFYSEYVNMLSEASDAGLDTDMSCIVLYSKYEQMALERIVGSKRSTHMLQSEQSTFVFK